LIVNEATHEQILAKGYVSDTAENNEIFQQMMKEEKKTYEKDLDIPENREEYIKMKKEAMSNAQNPIKILTTKILKTDSTLIMNEATKALKVFA